MKAVDIVLNACTQSSAEDFARLDAVGFPSGTAPVGERVRDVLEGARCPLERHFLVQALGQVVGGCRILPMEMKVAAREDGWIQVGGFGRISVYPHFRRLGYATGLMRLMLEASHAQGDVLALLYPSSFAVYRKYGFGIAAYHVLYSVAPRAFPDHPGRDRIRPARVDDWAAINRVYENQLHGSLGILRRSEEAWRRYYFSPNADPRHAQWLFEDGSGPAGYLSTRYEPTGNYYVQRLHVTEWFVSSHVAVRAILGFLRAQSANVELVMLPTPTRYALETALVEPVWSEDPDLSPWHQPVGKLCSTVMGRIIRIHEAIAARTFAEDGSVNLLVEDWSLAHNSGYYSLQVRGGRGELSRAAEGDGDVRLDIGVLSSLYCGALTAEQALMYGLLEASREAVATLDRMLGTASFMVWDYF